MKKKVGFVIGKFYPLHLGHEFLIEYAKRFVDKLYVLVDNHESYNLSLETRLNTVKKSFPQADIEVLGINESTWQEPNSAPSEEEFWEYWNNILNKYIPEKIDVIIGSMSYVKPLAKNYGCEYIIFDTNRESIDISATKIRSNPYLYWNYLAKESKPLFLKKFAVIGPESAGKSTLVKRLAKEFNSSYVPEFARTLIEHRDNDRNFIKEDFELILEGQYNNLKVLEKVSNKSLFLDTEALTTKLWAKVLNNIDLDINSYFDKNLIDCYFLIYPQKEWKDDKVRYQPDFEKRLEFYNDLKAILVKKGVFFVEVKTESFDDNFEFIKKYINKNYNFMD